MNDHRIDELLKDLDDALAVAPSAETVANVRSRIAQQTSSRWPSFSWRVAATIAAMVTLVVVVYARWIPHTTTTPSQIARVTPSVQAPEPTVQPPTPQPTTSVPTRIAHRAVAAPSTVEVASAPDDERLRVIVSPDQRRGVEQLQAAGRAGRITEKSFVAPSPPVDPPALELKALEIPSVAIEPFKVEPQGSTTGGGSVR